MTICLLLKIFLWIFSIISPKSAYSHFITKINSKKREKMTKKRLRAVNRTYPLVGAVNHHPGAVGRAVPYHPGRCSGTRSPPRAVVGRSTAPPGAVGAVYWNRALGVGRLFSSSLWVFHSDWWDGWRMRITIHTRKVVNF